MKVKTIGILIALCLTFTTCDKAMEDNFPEEYTTVLYFQEYGEIDINANDTKDEDMVYQLAICKGGNQPQTTASAQIEVMSQEQLSEYNENYMLLPSQYYTLSNTQLDFQKDEFYKTIDISLKTTQIVHLLKGGNMYVLLLQLTVQKGNVNPDANQIYLRLK